MTTLTMTEILDSAAGTSDDPRINQVLDDLDTATERLQTILDLVYSTHPSILSTDLLMTAINSISKIVGGCNHA